MRSSASKYFVEVARLGSIRKASKTLNVSASAISRQIMLLEHEVGTPIIERLARGVRLTDAGEVLFRSLSATALVYDEALEWIEEIKGGQRGRVKFASVEGLVVNFLPGILRKLNDRYPNVRVEILVVGAERVTDMLRDDECDIGVVIQPRDISELSVCATVVTDFSAVMPPDHPLAKRSNLAIAEVAPYPVILHASSFSTRTLVESAARREHKTLRVGLETNSIEGMKSFSKAGLGIIFVPAFVVERELKRGELVAVSLVDPEFRKLKLLVLVRQGRRLSPAANRLLDILVSGFSAVNVVLPTSNSDI